MVEIAFDASSFVREAQALGATLDQMPFIFSKVLNDAAFSTRQELIETTWPSAVEVHNSRFLGAALHINKATKGNLQVEIIDQLGRGNLALHAHGGTKQPRHRALAIPPVGRFSRGARGIAKTQRPAGIIAAAVPGKKAGTYRALRIIEKGMFLGAGGRLVLQYSFKSSAHQPVDVPFEADFRRSMIAEVNGRLPAAVRRAMTTRRED